MSAITMPFISIDTLQFSKRMQKAGLQREVAEELSEAIKDACPHSVEGIATKQDIKILEQNTKQDLKILEQKMISLDQKIDSLEYKITIKLFVMLSIAVALIAWLDKMIN